MENGPLHGICEYAPADASGSSDEPDPDMNTTFINFYNGPTYLLEIWVEEVFQGVEWHCRHPESNQHLNYFNLIVCFSYIISIWEKMKID